MVLHTRYITDNYNIFDEICLVFTLKSKYPLFINQLMTEVKNAVKGYDTPPCFSANSDTPVTSRSETKVLP